MFTIRFRYDGESFADDTETGIQLYTARLDEDGLLSIDRNGATIFSQLADHTDDPYAALVAGVARWRKRSASVAASLLLAVLVDAPGADWYIAYQTLNSDRKAERNGGYHQRGFTGSDLARTARY